MEKMAGSSGAFPTTKEFAETGFADQLPISLWPDALSTNNVCSDASKIIADFFVSPAEAGLGAGCYAICSATLGLGCAGCVLAGPPALVWSFNNVLNCIKSCTCTWYRYWCCLKISGCVALFVIQLAQVCLFADQRFLLCNRSGRPREKNCQVEAVIIGHFRALVDLETLLFEKLNHMLINLRFNEWKGRASIGETIA